MKLENLHLRLSLFEYSSLSSFSRNFRTSVPISRLFFLSPSSSNISSLLSNNTRTHPTEFTLPLEPRFELQSELALHVPFSFSLGKVEGGNRCSRCKTAGCTDSFNCGQIGHGRVLRGNRGSTRFLPGCLGCNMRRARGDSSVFTAAPDFHGFILFLFNAPPYVSPRNHNVHGLWTAVAAEASSRVKYTHA